MACLAGLILMLNSCQKEATIQPSAVEQSMIIKINGWLAGQQSKGNAPGSKVIIQSIKDNLDLKSLRVEKLNDSEQIWIIPLQTGFRSANNVGKNPINHLFLIVNKQGNIRRGNILQYIPDPGNSRALPVNALFNMFNHGSLDKNGRFAFLDIFDHWQYELTYRNGSVYSFSRNKFKSPQSSSGKIVADDPIYVELYLVTTYYYTDGSIETDEEDLGPYCINCFGSGGGGGGGGGGSSGGSGGGGGDGTVLYTPDDGNTVPVSKAEQFVVGNAASGSWTVYSFDVVSGQKDNSNPAASYFTGVDHSASQLFNNIAPNFASWTELQVNPYVDPSSNGLARVDISGKVSFSNGPDIKLDKTQVWIFLQEFP